MISKRNQNDIEYQNKGHVKIAICLFIHWGCFLNKLTKKKNFKRNKEMKRRLKFD